MQTSLARLPAAGPSLALAAVLALGAAGCPPSGASDAGYRTCSVPQDCGMNEACFGTYCIRASCLRTCTPNEGYCDGGRAVRCIIDQEMCPVWAAPVACGAQERCAEGRCVDTGGCEDECSAGTLSCSKDGRTSLGCELGEDACYDLVLAEACGEHQACSAGLCACLGECQDGEAMCGPLGGQINCEGPDDDGCFSWGEEIECPQGLPCEDTVGRCMPDTPPECFDLNECLFLGQKFCTSASQFRTCEVGDDGCLYWSPS